jgi:AcrR family transcriptional regulator
MAPQANATKAKDAQLTPRGQRTRNALVEAARTVFERDGYLNARITDIAEAAGVAHGTFYTYFVSKDEIFRAVIVALQDELMQTRANEPRQNGVESVYDGVLRANRRYLETWQAHTTLMHMWEEVAVLDDEVKRMLDDSRNAFIARSQSAIEALREQGVIDEEIDSRHAAFALTGMVSRFAYVWFTRSENFDIDDAAEQLSKLWVNALGISAKNRAQPLRRSKREGTAANGRSG